MNTPYHLITFYLDVMLLSVGHLFLDNTGLSHLFRCLSCHIVGCFKLWFLLSSCLCCVHCRWTGQLGEPVYAAVSAAPGRSRRCSLGLQFAHTAHRPVCHATHSSVLFTCHGVHVTHTYHNPVSRSPSLCRQCAMCTCQVYGHGIAPLKVNRVIVRLIVYRVALCCNR